MPDKMSPSNNICLEEKMSWHSTRLQYLKCLKKLFSYIANGSHFPKDCKVAKIKSMFEKGTKTDPKNFRPTSLLLIDSKVVEKVIHDQTMYYLVENSIFYRYLIGFHIYWIKYWQIMLLDYMLLKYHYEKHEKSTRV